MSRNKSTTFNCSSEELAQIDRAAEGMRVSRSEFARRVAVEAAKRRQDLLLAMLRAQPDGTTIARMEGVAWDDVFHHLQTGTPRVTKPRGLAEGMIVFDGSDGRGRQLRLVKRLAFQPADGHGEYWAYELLEGEGPWDIDQKFVRNDVMETVPGVVILPWIDPVGADS